NRHLQALVFQEELEGIAGAELAVDHSPPEPPALQGLAADELPIQLPSLLQRRDSQVSEELHSSLFRFLEAEPPGRPPVARVERSQRAALSKGPLGQALVMGRGELDQQNAAAGGRPDDSDVAGISAKGRDVFLNPADG